MRVGVLGHVEWVDFVAVQRLPVAGEIVHTQPVRSVTAGGGAVAAVALARWGADTTFFTSFGDDALGHRAHDELVARGVHVRATFQPVPQRRALTMIDAQRERTIILVGERHVARASDALPWDELATCDAVYITGGDAVAVEQARRAKNVVATARVLSLLRQADIDIDILVGSDNDPNEVYATGMLAREPRFVVRTNGARGGTWIERDGSVHPYAAVAARVTGDTYGAGDTFAAGLTYGLGAGNAIDDVVALAAARAAEVVAFIGPYPA